MNSLEKAIATTEIALDTLTKDRASLITYRETVYPNGHPPTKLRQEIGSKTVMINKKKKWLVELKDIHAAK